MFLKSFVLAGLLAFSSLSVFAQARGCDNPPVGAVVPLNQTATVGDTVTFTANITGGTPPYMHYWADLKGNFYGSTPSFHLINVQPSQEGLYFLMVWDANGCSSLTAGKLFVKPAGSALFSKELSFLTE